MEHDGLVGPPERRHTIHGLRQLYVAGELLARASRPTGARLRRPGRQFELMPKLERNRVVGLAALVDRDQRRHRGQLMISWASAQWRHCPHGGRVSRHSCRSKRPSEARAAIIITSRRCSGAQPASGRLPRTSVALSEPHSRAGLAGCLGGWQGCPTQRARTPTHDRLAASSEPAGRSWGRMMQPEPLAGRRRHR